MRKEDRECHRLCEIQALVFESSSVMAKTSSEVFFRRFMNSKIAKEIDTGAFLEDTKTLKDVFYEIEQQYGESSYGSVIYHKDVMYWAGYLYRHLCYCYEISSKRAYKLLPLKYVASSYEAYHALDISNAIERLLEEKNISLKQEDINQKALVILKRIKEEKRLLNTTKL